MIETIPYGKHNINDEDIQAVIKVLKSNNLTQGPKIVEFEDAFADYIGAKYAVAVANGTAALHLSSMVMNIKPGDKVITTPITFAASANCVRYCGGDVVFADIDPDTYLLDLENVRRLLKASPKGTYKGIIPVDFAGRAIDLEILKEISEEYGCWIIEDACHAPGGYSFDSKGSKQNCGNCSYSELAIFSFHPVKHIACGEGGMITTNDEKLYQRLRNLRTHGIQQIPELRKFNHGVWYYEMQELGFNYRLTDIQAALGISQLKRANDGLERRKEISQKYAAAFAGKTYIKRQAGVQAGHAYHLYIVEFEQRNDLLSYLRSNQILAQVHYIPVHLMPYYRQFGWNVGSFPIAEEYYRHCLSLPIYPSLADDEQNYVISIIDKFYTK